MNLRGTDYRWLDIARYCDMLRNEDDIQNIKYFSAAVKNPQKRARQERYHDALRASKSTDVEVILGHHAKRDIRIRLNGPNYTGSIKYKKWEEKETDVNIAINITQDARNNACDRIILISGDGDLTPAVRRAKELHKHVTVYIPALPKDNDRWSSTLSKVADKCRRLPERLLKLSVLPDRFINPDSGRIIENPFKNSLAASSFLPYCGTCGGEYEAGNKCNRGHGLQRTPALIAPPGFNPNTWLSVPNVPDNNDAKVRIFNALESNNIATLIQTDSAPTSQVYGDIEQIPNITELYVHPEQLEAAQDFI